VGRQAESDSRSGPGGAASAAPEAELDAMLEKAAKRRSRKQPDAADDAPDAVEVFRTQLRDVYCTVFEELRSKYAAKGLTMEMKAEDLLGGGTGLRFSFGYGDLCVQLDGTVTRGGVAFCIVRGAGHSSAALVSGPLLRIRNLSADDFRRFVVEQLSQLIKDALRRV
jgi:hypothetical protein